MLHAASKGLCCEPCRIRHYKCDERLPECGRCSRTGRQCIRNRNIRFRPTSSDKDFPLNQTWLTFPSRVEFVDETDEVLLQGTYDVHSIQSPERLPKPQGSSHELIFRAEEGTAPLLQQVEYHIASDQPSQHEGSPRALGPDDFTVDAVDSSCSRTVEPSPSSHHRSWGGTASPNETHQPYTPGSTWPLADFQEALLVQHFVDKISCFFDFCDRERHFAIEVPQRARVSRTLSNAILALSARHLSRTTEFDPFVSDYYYQECLKTLIPALDGHDATLDENLLAATVVLRLLEELDVPLVGSDMQGHSIGTQSFIRAQEENPMAPGLRQAAYWAGVRQEIYISLTLQRSPAIQPNSHHSHTDRSLVPADDCTWANRAIVHCADVLDFSFGTGPRSMGLHNSLKDFNRQWMESRPTSFDPLYFNENGSPENRNFPDIRMHTDWHVMGVQYLTLAHILLLVYDPSIPRVGPAHKKAISLVDRNVKHDIRTLCGIGLSNPSTPPAILIACMAINLCGDRFTDHQEQQQLLSILIQTEKLHGWPTSNVQHGLRDIWDWEDGI